MGQTDVICPNCGHDFRQSSAAAPGRYRRTGLRYSPLATLALVVGQIMSGLGCIISVIVCVVALISEEWVTALISGPVSALYSFGMMVVFARAQDME